MVALPKDVQVLGDELAIVWADGAETYLKLSDVRRLCPCASCAGEGDRKGASSTGDAQAQYAKDKGYSGTGLPPRPADGGGY